jgi:hypothetical protein
MHQCGAVVENCLVGVDKRRICNLLPEVPVKQNRERRRTMPQNFSLSIISDEKDHTVPWAIANASYKRQARNTATTEIREIPDRGHPLTIDHGWQEVAEIAFAFVTKQPGVNLHSRDNSPTWSSVLLAPHFDNYQCNCPQEENLLRTSQTIL